MESTETALWISNNFIQFHHLPQRLQTNLFWQILAIETIFILMTFTEQLVTKLGVPRQHFFRFLQIRCYTHKVNPQFPHLPSETQADAFLTPLPRALFPTIIFTKSYQDGMEGRIGGRGIRSNLGNSTKKNPFLFYLCST